MIAPIFYMACVSTVGSDFAMTRFGPTAGHECDVKCTGTTIKRPGHGQKKGKNTAKISPML